MGDSITFSPVLAEGVQAPSALSAVTAGLQQGQQFGAANALRGVDFNDPSNVDSAISGLVRHGAIDQANALGQLNVAHSVYADPEKSFAKIAKALSGQSSDTPTPATSSALPPDQPQQAPAQPQPATAPAYTPTPQLEGYQAASKAIDYLSQFPASERSKIWNTGVRQTLAQKFGVPEERLDAIDNVLKLPDEQGSDSALQVMKHIFDTAAHEHAIATGHPEAAAAGYAPPSQGASTAPPQANVQPPSAGGGGVAPSSPPTNPPAQAAAPAAPVNGPGGQGNWGRRLLESPDALMQISKLKMAGLDLSNVQSAANELAAPGIAREAAAPYERVEVPTPTGAPMIMSAAQFANETGQGKSFTGLTPAAEAYQEAGGRTLATAPYERVQVTTPSGAPRIISGAQFAGYTGQGGSFTGLTPGQQASQTGQADVATKLLAPNPDVLNASGKNVADIQRAMQAVAAVGKLDNSAQAKLHLAAALRTAGLGGRDVDQLTSNLSTANQLFSGLVATADKDTFGSRITNADLSVGQKSGISLWSPNDQVSTYLATKGALEQRKLAFERFKQTYTGDKTNPQAIYDAWNRQGGSTSIFAEPIWSSVQIGGKPAVMQRQIKGQTWLRVGAGTGHPFFVPLNGNEGEAIQ